MAEPQRVSGSSKSEPKRASGSSKSADAYDIAIVGGGPAGLTAALWSARYLHSVVLVDSGDPRNWDTRGINGYLGLPDIRPAQLRERGRDSCRALGVELVDGCVGDVVAEAEDRFRLTLGDGSYYVGRRILLAFGLKDEWPEIQGLERVYGDTAHVCPDCDGFEARGCKTVVIGAGKRAVSMALALKTWTPHIVICTNGAPADLDTELLAKLDHLNVPLIAQKVERAHSAGGRVTALEFTGGMMLDCERLFFTLGQYAADNLGVQLKCKRDALGRIESDQRCNTSVPNVFVAGDIVPGPQVALVAAGSGAIAAMAMHRSLLPEDLRIE